MSAPARSPRRPILLGLIVGLLTGQPLLLQTGCGTATATSSAEVNLVSQQSAGAESNQRPSSRPLVDTHLAGKRLAVLELKGETIKSDILQAFADAIRGGSVQGLVGSGIQVMTRENMLVLLKTMGKQDCAEGDCEVETARNIGADFVVSGSVVIIDGAYVVTLKLHETKGGTLLASDQVDANKQLEILHSLRKRGQEIVGAITPSDSSGRPLKAATSTRSPNAGARQPSFDTRVKSQFEIRMSNIDDVGRAEVNGTEVQTVKWGSPDGQHHPGDASWFNITTLLKSGVNSIRFTLYNSPGCCGVSGRFQVRRDGILVYEKTFDAQDSIPGVKFDDTFKITLD
jgi:TolB-like protein